ncbi:excinuclease ABC subunit UvrC [Patescibacteria group bacterium]|nr:excinuclease ABC subunit UvrC [Patescibacteria group bacterium]
MQAKLKKIPAKPGVYLFKNKDKRVIYVGKAINLKSRVNSYFQPSSNLAVDKQIMLPLIKKIDYVIVDNELEAIYLESNLIKKYQPKFNIILRDDKFFVYIKIPKEKFPRVLLTRRIAKDKAHYFGPYLSGKQAKRVIFTLRKLFPHRICNVLPKSVCLEYHLKHCNAPCIQAVSPQEYQEVIQNIINFLKGQYDPVLKNLKGQMKDYSDQRDFEKAAQLRDQIVSINQMIDRQKIISAGQENQDLISLAQEKDWGVINLLQIRQGKLINSQNFTLDHLKHNQPTDIITAFLEQYYQKSTDHPQEIATGYQIKSSALGKICQAKIVYAQKGKKNKLIKMGQHNAKDFLQTKESFIAKRESAAKQALAELAELLNIKPPRRLEAYDIANIQGQNAVGSMIVFTDGQPDKSQYRKFAIKTFDSANDPGMIREVITRRFSGKNKWPQPDLILVDGGKPQLNATLMGLGNKKIPLLALAKRLEEIWLPHQPVAIQLPPSSPALFLIQRVRDEAHRFATGYYQQKHLTKIIKSAEPKISGIGPIRIKMIKKELGSLAKINKSDQPKLTKLFGAKSAKKIINQLTD